MNQYPTWRYWLVIVALLASILLALPNAFRSDPALQLSRNDRGVVDEQGQQRIRSALDSHQVTASSTYLEDGRLVLRFATVEAQNKARDVIRDAAPGEYIIALTKASSAPAFMRTIGLKPMSLGLDLRGGVNFLYEVDMHGAIKQAVDRLERDTSQLRETRIGYGSIT